MRRPWLAVSLALLAISAAGCSCAAEIGGDDGGMSPRFDGESPELDADGMLDARTVLPDGRVVDCAPASCGGFLRLCGDCLDNDGDGLVDSEDPACIGPCDDTEDRYDLDIRDTPTCMRDCYYDNDQGSGNDGCAYDARCDELSPDAPTCVYTPGGGGIACPDTQPPLCDDVCGPLVPNGCDCFGCCELPAGSGTFVYLGGVDEASGTRICSPETVGDPTICRPCTPYGPCLNDCGRCELCLGRTELPAECLPSDGGAPADGGTPPPRCEPGVQACGLPSDPPCADGLYCLTGCCIFFG